MSLERGVLALLIAGSFLAAGVLLSQQTVQTNFTSPLGVFKRLRSSENTWLAAQSGNVGIGTTATVDHKLEVRGEVEIEVDNADSKLRFNDPGDDLYSMGVDRSDAGKFKINRGGNIGDNNDIVINDADGNVGIGTQSPAKKLHVAGDLRVDGVVSGNLDGSGNSGPLQVNCPAPGQPGNGNCYATYAP
ncbi:MAG: hypothetical protein HY401_07570 [Elusimicrobia bacterium]|nr:hypothetical protein [Elusimicrobiota bacterium]